MPLCTARLAALALLVGLVAAIVAPALLAVPASTALAQDEDGAAGDEEDDNGGEDAEEEQDGDEEEQGPPVLFGTLRSPEDGEVAGVELTIATADGEELGTVTSDDAGQWEFEVPEPGDYVVTLTSLPEGVELREEGAEEREVSVRAGRQQAVVFPLGEAATGTGFGTLVAQQTLQGLRFGLIIAMAAVGLSMVFGTTGLINFAHGEIVVFGAVVAWYLNATGPELHLVIAGALAVIATALLGGGLDRGIFRPLRKRRVGLFQALVVTIGLSLMLRFLILVVFGGQFRSYTDYVGQTELDLGPLSITPRDLTIMAISAGMLVLVGLGLQKSRTGKAMRAVADNRDLAESSGINVQRVVLIVWMAGSGLAGLGGVLYGSTVQVDYFFGFQLLLLMFSGVILGGLGTAFGAMAGSLVIGLVTELSVVFFPNELKYAWALGVLVLVLLFRPQGILGRRERIG